MTSQSFSYDRVGYPDFAYDYTHPGRLATMASLNGMQPAPIARCRVLELGCGAAGNIIPVAFQNPDSEVIGLDLAANAIQQGLAKIESLGLRNIALHHMSIADVGPEFGQFDYIIAHGVYSWVPQPVRDKMMAVFRANLSPQGVAYVSYNAHPGSHLRNLARDIMLFHTRDIGDPAEKVKQARSVLKFLADVSAKDTVHGVVLRDQFERVRKMNDDVLFHDDLEESGTAFLLTDVVRAAQAHGLQYLSEATLRRGDFQHLSGAAAAVLDGFPESELVAREQYQDFIEGHGFRRTLLCQGEITLQRQPGIARMADYSFATDMTPSGGPIDPAAPGVVEFKADKTGTVATDHRLSKAALLVLGETYPVPVSFKALLGQAVERLGPAFDGASIQDEADALATLLHRTSKSGQVAIHRDPPRLTVDISDRPLASRLARHEAERGPFVTNLCHAIVMLEDPTARRFLQLVDGTRTVDELLRDLSHDAASGLADQDASDVPIERTAVERNLRLLARLGLLQG